MPDPILTLHPDARAGVLYTQDEYLDLPRSTCPACGHHVAYDPLVIRDDDGAMRGVRIQALICDFCKVRAPLDATPV